MGFRALDRRRATQPEPMPLDSVGEAGEVLQVHRFHQERIGSKLISAIDVLHVLGSGKNDYPQRLKSRVGSYPLKDLEAVLHWHAKIQKQQRRQRVFRAIGKLALSLEVLNHFLAVPNDKHGIKQRAFSESTQNQRDMIVIILSEKDDILVNIHSNRHNEALAEPI